jgi:hypothetical protein
MVDDQHPTDWLSSSKRGLCADGTKPSWTSRHKTGLGLAFAGVVAGGVLAGALGASASTGGSAGIAPGYGAEGAHGAPPAGQEGGARPVRSDEKPLSASLTATLKAKALAAVAGGTVDRIESDSGDAVYEAHMTKADGTKVTVKFDKNLKVTGVEAGMGKGDPQNGVPHGGPGGRPGGPMGGSEGGGPRSGAPRGGPQGANAEGGGGA